MGGLFSGRNEYATTPDDRECMKLDVNEFTDILEPGARKGGTYSWSNGAELYWEVLDDLHDEAIQLTYAVGWGDGEQREEQYPVYIQRTECNFGGTRPW